MLSVMVTVQPVVLLQQMRSLQKQFSQQAQSERGSSVQMPKRL